MVESKIFTDRHFKFYPKQYSKKLLHTTVEPLLDIEILTNKSYEKNYFVVKTKLKWLQLQK